MLSMLLNPFVAIAQSTETEIGFRLFSFIFDMALKWQQNKYKEKLRLSEERRKRSEDRRNSLVFALLVVLAIVAVISINYRMVPRSLPA